MILLGAGASTLPSIIAAAGAIFAAIVGAHLTRKVHDVHVLVNSQLMEVKTQLEAVTLRLAQVTRERDHLDPAKPEPQQP